MSPTSSHSDRSKISNSQAISPVVPHPPAPSPEGGRGGPKQEKEFVPKNKMNPYILSFAREMRKHPTPAEKNLWKELRLDQLGVRFRRQHAVHRCILDFYCHEARLGVELDGGIHNEKHHSMNDKERDAYLSECNIRILRFKNEEVMSDPASVVRTIQSHLSKK